MSESIQLVDLSKIRPSDYKAQYVGCLVLTKDHKLLLQQRGHDFVKHPDYLCEFGGRIEQGEQPNQALIRELNEELGAVVQENEMVSLGCAH
jgi:8-oxo-dGTP diphosphatase